MHSSSSAIVAQPLSSPAPNDETTLSEQPGIADERVDKTEKESDLENGTPNPILVRP